MDGRRIRFQFAKASAWNALYLLALLIGLPWLVWRSMATKRYRSGLGEKLIGLVPIPKDQKTPLVWFHGVSVGEIQQLKGVIAEFLSKYPQAQVVVSSTTDSGLALSKKLFPDLPTFYFPFDFSWAVRLAMKRLRPNALVLVELEVWPNLVMRARASGCRVAIINGRLSEKSFRGYSKFRCLLREVFSSLTWVGTQDATYADRFRAMGVESHRVEVTGNIKYDNAEFDRKHSEVVKRREELGLEPDDLVWVVGSTQSPEELWALGAFTELLIDFPQAKLILVPRHPDRFAEVLSSVEGTKLPYLQRSKMGTKHEIQSLSQEWKVLVGDTVGELKWWWGLADIAFVGGSFGPRGGQNMIEPAAFGASVAVGPNTKNFGDIMRLLIEQSAITVLQDREAMLRWATLNLQDSELRNAIGHRAQQCVKSQRGAIAKTLEGLGRVLEQSP